LSDQQQLQNILCDTKELLLLAEEGNWSAVVELEQSRGLAIESLFKTPPVIEPKLLAEGIQFIIDKNKILTQFSHSQRDSIRMEMAKAGHAHKAIDKYLTS